MTDLRSEVRRAADTIRQEGIESPQVGIILGTGLSALADKIENQKIVEYSTIPGFEEPTVEFHSGMLVGGRIGSNQVVALKGRYHFYEGYSMKQITFPLYVLKELGVKKLLISNAAGNMNLNWSKGNLMLIDDHINLQSENPLRGPNDDYFGPRFPDMSQPYDPIMNEELQSIANNLQIEIKKGVYVSVVGPNLETRAEYRFLRGIGADAVGMSTVPEAIVANYLGIPVSAVSVLTDDCDPDNLKPANIQEILAIAKTAEKDLTELFFHLIRTMDL